MEMRILLVEDNAEFRQIFAHALELAAEQLGVTFVESGSMSEARARLQEGGLDAALIDVTLPDGNGLDLVREINDGVTDGVTDRIPTLVLTAGLDHSVAAEAVGAGAQGAQSKAVSMPETVEAVKRLMGHQ
jgi:two-component system catabolic regulation response regulator CreB